MQTPWVSCSASLPRNGESIHFLLDDRQVSMEGTYAGGAFHSRWNNYEVGRVRLWCALGGRMPAAVNDVLRGSRTERVTLVPTPWPST
ncbi:MAG: hypothetical protein ABI843_03450 [Dokdonella sp.]